jgi:hypothetical protein
MPWSAVAIAHNQRISVWLKLTISEMLRISGSVKIIVNARRGCGVEFGGLLHKPASATHSTNRRTSGIKLTTRAPDIHETNISGRVAKTYTIERQIA